MMILDDDNSNDCAIAIGTHSTFENGKSTYQVGPEEKDKIHSHHAYYISGIKPEEPADRDEVTHFVMYNPWGPHTDPLYVPVSLLKEVIKNVYVLP